MGWRGEKLDTGWVDITPDSGNQDVTAREPAYRIIGDHVTFRGRIEKVSGSWTASASTTLVSGANALPTAARPSFRRDFFIAGSSATSGVKLLIDSDGSLTIITSATVPAYVDFSGVSFYV